MPGRKLLGPAAPDRLLIVGAAGGSNCLTGAGGAGVAVVAGVLVLGLYVNDPDFVLPNSKFCPGVSTFTVLDGVGAGAEVLPTGGNCGALVCFVVPGTVNDGAGACGCAGLAGAVVSFSFGSSTFVLVGATVGAVDLEGADDEAGGNAALLSVLGGSTLT